MTAPLARHLAMLRELGLLERRVPVTKTQPANSRRGPHMAQYRFAAPRRRHVPCRPVRL